ncbi:UDP-N-acetylmuramoyl-L-alanyl-D-glutamate--2,6-diaminopimelate ligase [Chitinimonas sp. BJB300]|uniref:UDP-N-acetylmuramoyl-L-alanyl-D-glutamate--2, 6-diaminopimelate ligase n=1 Tax=Chitinimonas sp. BJB300 TaxID=1559339 RepID=UPI000C0EB627|nr:UDP-N-acetylmuramoyl-L-alanyl-D-glutamate--2,6-diaminopimelate ligase [Chitinimonas sp. BJB300]PHV12769.1 UDP-N-acetylmuramoyl-L-alanyl-D-glutamate--2,6-diaminopimelate ligase [Chitinimonas sp. BJB300]TSJ91361.1 UDP-N-acetylmuramoyl-L-alanyl-D-glutamate--2,6-diaminopimelate ligase [Chitinimonas sp. BJB300]
MKPASWALPSLDWTAIDAIAAGRHLVADSRRVKPGDAFLAFQGEYSDGRSHIANAIAAGAGCVLWEAENFSWPVDWQTPNLAIPQLRAQAGIIASHLLGNPSQSLWTIGITGTNGKTSCAHWLAQAFTLLGKRPVLLGTLGYGALDALTEASHTTPDALRLHNLLAEFRETGATHLAMEVSSHGIEQARVHGVEFDVAVFTNLTRDHLDYHGSMAAYGAAKRKLFEWEGLQTAIINSDDAFGVELLEQIPKTLTLSYGLNDGDLRATKLACNLDGIHMHISSPWGPAELKSPLLGSFNAYNLLACLGVLLKSDVSLADAVAVLEQVESAKGRMQRLGGGKKPLLVVDYAHTPDALENALSTLREVLPASRRLFCVFGCGGDRDKGKRPQMGRIACHLADTVIITNDNPRKEDPKAIIRDILAGVDGVAAKHINRGDYSILSNRAAAIRSAIELAEPGDIVLIAGKGHEEYQDANGVKTPFSDVNEAEAALAVWKAL